jgi:hypothetical protein
VLHGERIVFISGTVEILFRRYTDAPRGCCNYLYPEGMQVTGYGRLPISGRSYDYLSVLCASSEAGGEYFYLEFNKGPNPHGGK